jgi:hypothetical protein
VTYLKRTSEALSMPSRKKVMICVLMYHDTFIEQVPFGIESTLRILLMTLTITALACSCSSIVIICEKLNFK